MCILRIFLSLFVLVSLPSGVVELWADDKPHAVLVVGTLHYSPEKSMPLFAEELERFGFKTTVVVGEGNPERKDHPVLPGIEALYHADLAIFFMRFLTLSEEELKPIYDYVTSGKPIVGLRTSSHSFIYPEGHRYFKWNDGFGRRTLGTPYIFHQRGTTECELVEQFSDHPILAHVESKTFTSAGTLYLTRLEPGCIPLVIGTGHGKSRLAMKTSGPVVAAETEKDIVAWAWENEWGGRVFGTSFGHPGDFAESAIVRILINGACWAADHPLPPANAQLNTWQIRMDH